MQQIINQTLIRETFEAFLSASLYSRADGGNKATLHKTKLIGFGINEQEIDYGAGLVFFNIVSKNMSAYHEWLDNLLSRFPK